MDEDFIKILVMSANKCLNGDTLRYQTGDRNFQHQKKFKNLSLKS